jgi:hypothetical protein
VIVDRYIAASEQSDLEAVERLLADDAILEMTGTSTWFAGKKTCLPFIATQASGRSGDWRMLPSRHFSVALACPDDLRLKPGGRASPTQKPPADGLGGARQMA